MKRMNILRFFFDAKELGPSEANRFLAHHQTAHYLVMYVVLSRFEKYLEHSTSLSKPIPPITKKDL